MIPDGLTSAVGSGLKLAAEVAVLCKRLFKRFPRTIRERSGVDRRQRGERRLDIKQRLRRGLWREYHWVTESGKFDEVPRDLHHRNKVVAALLAEARRYHFRDRENHSEVSASNALERVIDHIWINPQSGVDGAGQSRAVYLVEAIAQELYSTFDVQARDRRHDERRAAFAAAAR